MQWHGLHDGVPRHGAVRRSVAQRGGAGRGVVVGGAPSEQRVLLRAEYYVNAGRDDTRRSRSWRGVARPDTEMGEGRSGSDGRGTQCTKACGGGA